MTQFAMVEELASLVKENLYSKHLILSTEETLINFLKDNNSVDGILELQPTGSYNRLLLHRIADIYGFAHESIGEGEDRHLVLQLCAETAIPSVLVSDILGEYDESDASTSSQNILRREKDESDRTKMVNLFSSVKPFEEREAAYLAARDRIFSSDSTEERENKVQDIQKPKHDPTVARRMIAHALGRKDLATEDPKKNGKNNNITNNNNNVNRKVVDQESLKKEQIVAAKRIFANALGLKRK